MSIPWKMARLPGVLDVTTHYFEFIPEDEIDRPNPTVPGARSASREDYYIVPIEGGPLLLPHLGLDSRDRLLPQDADDRVPRQGSRFANLTGEKLSEHHVTQSVDRVVLEVQQPLTAYSLAPCWDDSQPYYGLFLEEQDAHDAGLLRRFLTALDLALGENNIEYEAKRSSGRLGPVRAHVLPSGFWANWDRERVARTGGSPEQYKHPCLIGDVGFSQSLLANGVRAAA